MHMYVFVVYVEDITLAIFELWLFSGSMSDGRFKMFYEQRLKNERSGKRNSIGIGPVESE